jgi:hypothetical protein
MICPPCKRAGELNQDALRATDEKTAEWNATRAVEAHGQCFYPGDCGCQHRPGDWRQRRSDG